MTTISWIADIFTRVFSFLLENMTTILLACGIPVSVLLAFMTLYIFTSRFVQLSVGSDSGREKGKDTKQKGSKSKQTKKEK